MKEIFIWVLLLFPLISFSERIDGPANIRLEPEGELRFSLNDLVEVECTAPKEGWHEIMISIKLTKDQYESNPLILKKGAKLYDSQNNEIGEALTDLRVGSKSSAGGALGIPKWYSGDLFGYTYTTNIKPESIVEPMISKLISSNDESLNFDIFRSHISSFNYRNGLKIPGFEHLATYMIYENAIDDISPLDRIRLIFEKDILIAVVHSRELQLDGYETVKLWRKRQLTLIKDFDSKERLRFIEKNNMAYSGVD